MDSRLVGFYKWTRDHFTEMYKSLNLTRRQCRELQNTQSTVLSLREMADTLYVLREATKLYEDSLKELNKAKGEIERLFCTLFVDESLAGNFADDKVRTEHCSVEPDIKVAAKLPTYKQDPESYLAMMADLGFDTDTLVRDGVELARPYWPGIQERINTLATEGKPLPKGLKTDETFRQFAVKIRKKMEILDNE